MRVRVRAGVGQIVLSRPATGNRFDDEMCAALAAACEGVAAEASVRVVRLEAEGRHFSLGLPDGVGWPESAWPDPVAALAAVPQPVVAMIQGTAVGWGFALALAADLRIAARGATLAVEAPRDGRFPGGGITQRLTRVLGPARAMQALLLGGRWTAVQAVRTGLVGEVVPADRLRAIGALRAAALAARGPLAMRFAKEAVVRALDLTLDDGLRLEQDLYVLLQTTTDRRAGVRSFIDRRQPRFRGV